MNPWDAFTWLAAVALAASGIAIFAFFLRDARAILTRDFHHEEEDSDSWEDPGQGA
jgi:hypothetical protein